MTVFDIIIVIFTGLVLGSFATALAHRIPLDLSIVMIKRSRCPACHANLGASDLVPLFSWIFLRGRCRHCHAWIGWRYPLIEIATLSVCLVFYAVYGLRIDTFLIFALAPVLISIVDIDVRHKIIPDSLTLSILLTGVALLLLNALISVSPLAFLLDKGGEAAGGVLLYGLGSLLLRQGFMMVMKREPMGLGDIKFYAAAGFWMGFNVNAASLFMIVSGMSGIVSALVWKKRTGDAEAPFGPALVMALIVVLYFCMPSFIHL